MATYDYPPSCKRTYRRPSGDEHADRRRKAAPFGLDVYVTRLGPRLSGWLSYTVGDTRREAYGQKYAFDYDRRHSATLVGSYRFSPRFQLSATARAASGFPWTPFAGVRVTGIEIGDRVVPEHDLQGRLVYEVAAGPLSALNSARLPFYARLDLRAAFRPRGDKGRWEFYVEAINALRRENVSGIEAELEYDPLSDRPKLVENSAGSLPLLPTFGCGSVRLVLHDRGTRSDRRAGATRAGWAGPRSPGRRRAQLRVFVQVVRGRSCGKYTTTSCSCGSTQRSSGRRRPAVSPPSPAVRAVRGPSPSRSRARSRPSWNSMPGPRLSTVISSTDCG